MKMQQMSSNTLRLYVTNNLHCITYILYILILPWCQHLITCL